MSVGTYMKDINQLCECVYKTVEVLKHSAGDVATFLKYDCIFTDDFTVNLPLKVPVKG